VDQVRRLGPKAGSHLALFCIHCIKWVTHTMTLTYNVSTINIVLALFIIIIIIITTTTATENLSTTYGSEDQWVSTLSKKLKNSTQDLIH